MSIAVKIQQSIPKHPIVPLSGSRRPHSASEHGVHASYPSQSLTEHTDHMDFTEAYQTSALSQACRQVYPAQVCSLGGRATRVETAFLNLYASASICALRAPFRFFASKADLANPRSTAIHVPYECYSPRQLSPITYHLLTYRAVIRSTNERDSSWQA